ncbi:hypothetical protein RGU70_12410 [Herbaspirillum sp. RTI4]|nr:hypothetical protein [Herbaspirillum sp. RTI4]MDY7579123.1 hypothetical protein [Herbaspirillum sp. RTI4]MEA9981298.1 hypothetical protein [Herbaspirillum sp. RTI4]
MMASSDSRIRAYAKGHWLAALPQTVQAHGKAMQQGQLFFAQILPI